MRKKSFSGFVSFYKWHIIFTLIVFICLSFMGGKFFSKVEGDLRIGYSATVHMNAQTFSDMKGEFELLIRDANGDEDKKASVETFASENIEDVINSLKSNIKSDKFDIYIADKEAFEAIEDKSVFADSKRYFIAENSRLDTLKDKDGRIFAVSLRDNSLAKACGISENENLYIAAAKDKGSGESTHRKNGMNISGYIIENRNKYNMN